MPTILLIRHAQASYGEADYDVLSPRAEEQIAALRAALERRAVAPARVVAGPARRQRQTAAGALPGREVAVDPAWDEYATDAVLTAHALSEARLEAGGAGGPALSSGDFQLVLDGALAAWIAAGAESGSTQTWPRFSDGVGDGLQRLAGDLGRGETAVVFTSAGAIAAACASLLGGAPEAFVAFNRVQVNTGISKIAVGRSGLSLVSFNDHGHLDDVDRALVTYR